MNTYCYVCNSCGEKIEDMCHWTERKETMACKCGNKAMRDFGTGGRNQLIVLNETIVDDLGDGEGRKAYTRNQYIEACKKGLRDPVGLNFVNKQVLPNNVDYARTVESEEPWV
jgi:hypothetical protein